MEAKVPARPARRTRRRLLLPFGGVAVALCVASAAWACTPVGGGIAASTPNSGPPGTAVTVTVTGGFGYTGAYTLHFNDPANVQAAQQCHHSTQIIGQGAATVSGSDINQVGSANIPGNATQGNAELCYAQGRVGVSTVGMFSPDAAFTVT